MKLNWWSLIFPGIEPAQVHGRVTYGVHHNHFMWMKGAKSVLLLEVISIAQP